MRVYPSPRAAEANVPAADFTSHTDAYQDGRDSRDAEIAALKERAEKAEAALVSAALYHRCLVYKRGIEKLRERMRWNNSDPDWTEAQAILDEAEKRALEETLRVLGPGARTAFEAAWKDTGSGDG